MATRFVSPDQRNPLDPNQLRHLLSDLLDCALLANPRAPRLIVAARDVETGQAVVFDNGAITEEMLLASCWLALVLPAVQINGRA